VLKRLSAPARQYPDQPARLERHARRQYCGWSGLALGILALALALLPGWIAPTYDPPARPIQQKAADWFGDLKGKAIAAIRMEPAPPPPPQEVGNPWRNPRVKVASLVLGFSALVLGILAFVRHEDQRMVACAVALGAGAIAAEYLLTAAMILAFAVLVGAVLSRSG
jgi:hypothetical protein